MPLQVIARVARLKPGAAQEYRRLHQEEWCLVRELYRNAGFRRFQIFHREPEDLLVSVVEFEGIDPDAAFKALWADPRIGAWREICASHQEPLPSETAGIWAPMNVVLSDDLAE